MKSPINILHLEDDLNDAELIQSTLDIQGVTCTITRVQTREDFVFALEHDEIDLVLSDFSLPTIDGLSAAKLVHTRRPNLPVIIVSGSLDGEVIVDSFKTGVTDCISKAILSRLAPAVRRAMQEVEERSERRRLEAQVIESQKMEVISQLSSGVAHDFNNILAVIVGYSELITSGLGADHPLQRYTEEIRHASNRAAGLTRQLLVFSRKQMMQPIVVDPNDAVKDLDRLLRRLIDQKIEITIVSGKQTGLVKADANYIWQLLLNLVLNARDAMPDGGKLIIEINDITLDNNYSNKHHGTIPGNYVMLSVSDTGIGMTEEVKAHLFEAFFTTKPYGTGLGLATCRTIVQQCGGHIEVTSEIGKGTIFKIYLPRVERSLDVAPKPFMTSPLIREISPDAKEVATSREFAYRVLVVDDDLSIREVTIEMLTGSGFEVDGAADGAAGWEALQAKRYDLLITDNYMPKLTGVEMVNRLEAGHIQLPVIMATALFPKEEFIRYPWLGKVTTILKPYSADEFLSTVRKVLGVAENIH
jgi:two-component system, cell cycle sensor histidine kinase and response regulator CckA